MRTGVERLVADPGLMPGSAAGLFTNHTGVLPDMRRTADAMLDSGVRLTTLFTPEHGLWGTAQAGESDTDGRDAATGLQVIDTYRLSGAELDTALRMAGIDVLVYDLQDIGARFYTYVWSLFDLLCSAARTGVAVVVLDRPNPLGGEHVAGPGLHPDCSSFIGRVSIPIRHGRTVGELAAWFNHEHVPAQTERQADLKIVTVEGWRREMLTPEATRAWVMPSPNIPAFDTALVYPGTCLFEGTNVSEGRGTTRPFEIIGAPFVDSRLVSALRERRIPGAAFREVEFRPTFHAYSGVRVRGVQLHVTDQTAFEPVTTGVEMLSVIARLYRGDFRWRENDPGRPPFIDLLWGSPALRHGIDADAGVGEIVDNSPAAPASPDAASLYSAQGQE